MIFTFSGADKGFDSIFHGRELDVNMWKTQIPSPDMNKSTLFDPQLLDDLYNPNNFKAGVSYVGSLYLYNTVTSLRFAVGKLASVVGFLKNEFNNISNMFVESADSIDFIFKTVNSIINSDFFQKGLDAIGAIPIVGWIIKIIAKIAELVYKAIDYVAKNKVEKAKQQLVSQPWIPIAEFNETADESLNKFMLTKLADGDLEWLFSPRNYFEKFEDFNVLREKRIGSDDQPLSKTDFFNITSHNMDGHGLGFIPGGTTIAGPMRFPTSACAEVLNAGELYPTALNTAGSVYQIVQKNGPALFSIYSDRVLAKWETTISNLCEYANKSIKLGWTCSPTGEFNTNKFICNSDTEDRYAVKGCDRKLQYGNKVNLPASMTGHYSAFLTYLGRLFFENGSSKCNSGWQPKETVPGKALTVLKARQYAIIDSINCMYVNDSTIGSLPRFSAIYNDKPLNTKWKNNVNAVLNSKEEWKKVVFWDVPDGEIKESLRELAKKANLNPEKPGAIDPGTMSLKIPSILPEPKIPDPYEPKGFKGGKSGRVVLDDKKSSTDKSSMVLPIAIAGIGAAYFFLKGR